ncbi:MAG: class II D-tagatose-bisphosphate aldolase, non-catalytic subunit [archaeon]
MKADLGLGPMSTEIIEAVFKYSHYYRTELMLIASKNQIDHAGGYVNNWNTKQYMEFIKEMRKKYANSFVKICRDHCGPGFNGNYELDDTYKTIKADIAAGFDLIHIDFCKFKGSQDEMFEESKKAIEYCKELNKNILIEVGTDENEGMEFTVNELGVIERDVEFFKDFCEPEFYVVQTGSLVKEITQAGTFNKKFVEKISKFLHDNNIKLKEHNADYLSKQEILDRRGVVDAMNIAPQLGVVQTSLVLNKCLMYGIDFDDFVNVVYEGKKWEKWLDKNSPENKFLCAVTAGHYHFASDEYKTIIEKLSECEDINESIINAIMEVIDYYESGN